ncbi:methionine ABC transporter permease [Microbacterium azadirachtae]|uniref:methionine ABC transporter permease n=1 Tax=Microbacterium azadirachtae TaxID=582680 RepID=UPI00088FB765|nr:methionine ABC transporter permease [Microbacterium azadirachtae]SDM30246.1 D-methionine transport system permease protein [Microbacterium azadirachtae]SEG47403.1 D-methionine transport system permease protein [Microbacterium azadirachtae]SEG52275.1 D-methionine transport system permease protein [Microbacterium azadirachtae]
MDRLIELLPDFWQAAVETLYMTTIALVMSGVIGTIIGIGLYVTRPGGLLPNRPVSIVISFLVNFIRPIPFVIFIAVLQPFTRIVIGTGIGINAGAFAIGVAASFAIGRIVEQHLVSVSPGVIEAARSMGAGPWRILLTVVMPEALGPLILGYTFIVVALIDMTAMAGLVGGGGLGAFAQVYGFRQFEPVVMWAAIILIVVFVHLVQTLGTWLARRIMRR